MLQQVLPLRLLPLLVLVLPPLLVVLGQLLHLEVELELEAPVLHHPVVMEEAVEVAIKTRILLRAILIQLEVTIKIQIPLGIILIQVVRPLILNLTQRKQSIMK